MEKPFKSSKFKAINNLSAAACWKGVTKQNSSGLPPHCARSTEPAHEPAGTCGSVRRNLCIIQHVCIRSANRYLQVVVFVRSWRESLGNANCGFPCAGPRGGNGRADFP